MNYSIRNAREDEGSYLSELSLRSKAHWGYDNEFLKKCRPHLIIDESYITDWPVRILHNDLNIIGYASLKSISGENRLDNLWIEPEFIKQGYGTILFNDIVDKAKELKWDYFRLAAEEKSINFYKKLGLKSIGKVQSRLGESIFLNHMEYKIV